MSLNQSSANESQSQTLRIKKVSHYLIGQLLGRGSFGEVHVATHQISKELVALKVLDKSKLKERKDYEGVVREIRILKMLSHPNIVDLIEVLDSHHNIYIVTEYAANGSLLRYMQEKGKLDEKEACKYFVQIVSAVQYCHTRRVVHRDLKLENILIDRDDNIKIVDFGLSNVLASEEKMKTHCGSPNYVAPEILFPEPYSGPQIDVWACGVILHIMLCGRFPFEGQSVDELYEKIVTCRFDVPSHISPEAKDLIERILVTNPQRRISLIDALKHPFVAKNSNEIIANIEGNIDKKADFRLILKIASELNWNGLQILYDVVLNKHTQQSATYYLMHEKKKKEWAIEEQAIAARKLGFILKEDNHIEPIIEQDKRSTEEERMILEISNNYGKE